MPAPSRFVREPLLRVLAVLGAAALTLTLFPATAHSQEDDFDPTAACPVDAPGSDFDDRDEIPAVHVDNVDCGAFFEIVLGFTGGDFGPTQPVSRAQMASFIGRTLDSADVALPEAGEGRDFTDVESGNVHRGNIRRLEAAGITLGGPLGRSEDEFGPNLRIRRDQMVSFIVRAAEFAFAEDFDSSEQQFDDVDEDNVHFENVNFGGEVGLVQGRTADTFDPGADTRRDQTSAFVVRLLNFLTTPAEVEITEQSAESASVGETITVTATAFSQYRDEAAATASDTDRATLEGEDVTFSAEHAETTGVVVPPQSQTVETNEDGEASFSFTAVQTGTVTVTASIDGPGGTFVHADGDSDSAEKQFVLPAEGEPGDYTGEVISSVYEEGTDEGSLVLRGERLNPEEGVFSLLFDSGDQFRLCPGNDAGDAFDGAALDCETATAAAFNEQAQLGDGVDVEYAPGEAGTSTFWLYDGAATELQAARFAEVGDAGTFGDEAGDTVVLDFDGTLETGQPEDHQDVIVHVDQQGDAGAIDCGEEGIACVSGPSLETLEDNQFGVVVTDPANSTDVADLADHLVVGIDNLLDAGGDSVTVPEAGVDIQAVEPATLPDLLGDLGFGEV